MTAFDLMKILRRVDLRTEVWILGSGERAQQVTSFDLAPSLTSKVYKILLKGTS